MKVFLSLFIFFSSLLHAQMLVGAGGFDLSYTDKRYSFKTKAINATHVNITQALLELSPNVNAVSMWIIKEWEESWYDVKTVQSEVIDKGYIPVFIFYWFADEISPQYVQEHKEAYFHTLQRFTKYLKKLKGQKVVIVNPEYNEFGTGGWVGMNEIFLRSFEMLREDPQVLVGPCVGDFGNYDKTNDPKEWESFDPSLKEAAISADFIAFQEMRALTRNKAQHIEKTPQRALNLARYLHQRYHKPTFLAYLAISSYGKDAEQIQSTLYKDFLRVIPRMQEEAELIGFNTFHYFDYPGHQGYFNEAEEFFGLLDNQGRAKASLEYFNLIK